MKITADTYNLLQNAYDFFNDRLWGNRLPQCLIVIHRKGSSTLGYYWPDQFTSKSTKDKIDEISLTPHSLEREDNDVLSTLVHEMAHLWQQHFGSPSRNGYHNREWGTEMKRIGLMPSNTGEPGGKQTGQQMTHYEIKGGAYALAFEEWRLNQPIIDVFGRRPGASRRNGKSGGAGGDTDGTESKTSKQKFTCADCGQNAWAKPTANLMCGDCETTMEEN